MLRFSWTACTIVAFLAAPAAAKPWADALFEQQSHDFGAVPRGPLLTHYYRLTNKSNQPLHIAGVRVSCGCVSANALQQDLAPGQSTAILAQMDSRRFIGAKQVTIFVTFDRPQWEEVRLSISAFGRDDLGLESDGIAFGTVTKGATSTAKTNITLRQPNWAITGATSDSGFVVPTVKEIRRNGYETTYELTAALRPGLPAGKWTTEITVATNSPASPTIRLPATVEVTPTLVVSPGEIQLGAVSVGSPTESKILIRGIKAFKIKEIQGIDDVLSATTAGNEARPVHVLSLKVSPTATGELSRKLKIVTDLPTEGTAEVTVKAQVSGK